MGTVARHPHINPHATHAPHSCRKLPRRGAHPAQHLKMLVQLVVNIIVVGHPLDVALPRCVAGARQLHVRRPCHRLTRGTSYFSELL